MTISQYLKKNTIKFQNHHIPNPQMEAEELLSFVINKNREFIIAHPEYKLGFLDKVRLGYLSFCRTQNTPLAYLIGKKEFYGLEFIVNKHTLIPRPETEMIVDEILDVLKSQQNPNKEINIIDVGTGTACIPISIIKNLNTCHLPLATCHFHAIDISPKALKVAHKNSAIHNTDKQLSLYQGNLLEPIITKLSCSPCHCEEQSDEAIPSHKNKSLFKHALCGTGLPRPFGARNDNLQLKSNINILKKSKFIISANLPYLTPEQVKNSPSIQKEPELALLAGQDGLDCYRELFKQIKQLVSNKLINDFYLICEIDPAQTEAMEKLSLEYLGLKTKTKKDLRGLDRFVVVNCHSRP
jgi:release factor glutamine methyltransferase